MSGGNLRLGATVALLIALLVAVGAVGLVHHLAAPLQRRAAEQLLAEQITRALPLPFDNDLVRDREALTAPALTGGRMPLWVYRAWLRGNPVGVVLHPVVSEGYRGPIELAVGIRYDGTVAGVRVTRQHETPGIGDRVARGEARWLEQFAGRSLADPPPARWALAPDGPFDGVSGATVSSAAVLRGVLRALQWYAAHRDALW